MRLKSLIAAILAISFFCFLKKPPLYSINKLPLPAEMDKQVCISGTKFMNGKLYFASERCPVIFTADLSGNILNSIHTRVPQNFEMEGITSYKDKLYLVSENMAAVYEVSTADGATQQVETSITLPAKTKDGDGLEGIAANELQNKFYLLRERNENMTRSQILTFSVTANTDGNPLSLTYESTIELPLQNPQWRYSDICFDSESKKLICLKSYAKGKMRQQYLESIDLDNGGSPLAASLKNIPVEDFSAISNKYKDQDYSMNLEGITLDDNGNFYIVSDNISGKAVCDAPAKEKTILLLLKKQ
jgi:uncharacterized protein YjiK